MFFLLSEVPQIFLSCENNCERVDCMVYISLYSSLTHMPSQKASSPRKTSSKKRAAPAVKAKRATSRRALAPRQLSVSMRFSQWIDTVSPTSILAIGLCVVVISIIHSLFVDIGYWYTPFSILSANVASWIFEFLLTGIFALATFSIVLVWNIPARGRAFIMWLFVLAGMLQIMWSMFFFALHLAQISFVDIVALWMLVVALVLLCWKRSRMASVMLLPYLAWITFVGVLNALMVFQLPV